MPKQPQKTKQFVISAFSDRIADGVCAVTGDDLAVSEAAKFNFSVDLGDSNTIGTGERYIGPGNGPTVEQANALVLLILAEVGKWSK